MCVLKVYSDSMSFEDYAHSTNLPLASCHVKGQVRRKSTGELHKVHRISFSVSDKDWNDFKGQVADAIKFLALHELELHALLGSHDGMNAYLDFPLYSRLSSEIVNQNDHLPRELIALAGRIGLGIEMAIYDKGAFEEIEA
jgi:hypothetical protein